ncbi:hypothetical protein HL653_03990 [Sphingomonas sp. AP4-R1]|uniref:hypothetical protein n=1 Tax=Sphingomonas sp. AP4-R1 TaxID=2735134 RepID=UPI00149360E8|nr:hypothetical protein [Sphingomonas sp. AP4-R1]QJU57060.1 hypothetical protein HL653_03990 [Sphingomonas sp. AP4-R1]
MTGPVAVYWVSAATSSGFGFGGLGSGQKKPSMGDIMSMMRGGGSRPIHLLELALGSSRTAPAPDANHLPGTGPALPLVTPTQGPPARQAEETRDQPDIKEPPKARILIYWGCGEKAPAGQPFVLDLSKIMAGQPMPRLPYVTVHHQNPPTVGRYATFGGWPNARSRDQQVPQSLLGSHQVKGNYSPDIAFILPPGKDWMPPLQLDAAGKSPGGGTILRWQAIPAATGYFATLFGGAAEGGREDGATIVMWSSSGVQVFADQGLLDFLAPAEVKRLIDQKVVMPPATTQCVVPAEVTTQARSGIVSMIAYGDEANFADPPRPADPKVPWNISWTTKVRYKSTTGLILGMPSGPAGDESNRGRDAIEGQRPPEQSKKKGGLFNKLKGAVSPF